MHPGSRRAEVQAAQLRQPSHVVGEVLHTDLGLGPTLRSRMPHAIYPRGAVRAIFRVAHRVRRTKRAQITTFQYTSDVSGQGGRDAGLGFTLGRNMGPAQAYKRLGVDWTEDYAARSGQPTARNETTALAEIGYAWSLDPSGLGRLAVYARHERSDANLSIYDSATTTVGIGLRLGF